MDKLKTTENILITVLQILAIPFAIFLFTIGLGVGLAVSPFLGYVLWLLAVGVFVGDVVWIVHRYSKK